MSSMAFNPDRIGAEEASALDYSIKSTRIHIAVGKTTSTEDDAPRSDNMSEMELGIPAIITDLILATPDVVSPTPRRHIRTVDPALTNASTIESKPWPTQSAHALPKLAPNLAAGLASALTNPVLQFPTNADPCAVKISPTGRLFTDGTVRLYDLTGTFSSPPRPEDNTVPPARSRLVLSNAHAAFGAVAAQIHAKGVHTSLLMDLDVSPDGLYLFGGALRGSMELVAVLLGDLEAALSCDFIRKEKQKSARLDSLLDHVTVHRHSDAKLRGFSACTRLQSSGPPQYLLLTGRGIKNCHVWRFVPPHSGCPTALFEKLVDVPTNGTTIKFLQFRRADSQQLQVVSKSDDFRVRLWDLPDQDSLAASQTVFSKPTSWTDVPNTESALGLAGGDFMICGGGHECFNQISVVSLAGPVQDAMELALPGSASGSSYSSSRRHQRGDLKSCVSVAGMVTDSAHALLEISDGTVIHYSVLHGTLGRMDSPSGFGPLPTGCSRKLTVGRIGAEGIAVAAVATFDPAVGRGRIQLRALDPIELDTRRTGFWGFLGSPVLMTKSDDLHDARESIKVSPVVALFPRSLVTPSESATQGLKSVSSFLPVARQLAKKIHFSANTTEKAVMVEHDSVAGKSDQKMATVMKHNTIILARTARPISVDRIDTVLKCESPRVGDLTYQRVTKKVAKARGATARPPSLEPVKGGEPGAVGIQARLETCDKSTNDCALARTAEQLMGVNKATVSGDGEGRENGGNKRSLAVDTLSREANRIVESTKRRKCSPGFSTTHPLLDPTIETKESDLQQLLPKVKPRLFPRKLEDTSNVDLQQSTSLSLERPRQPAFKPSRVAKPCPTNKKGNAAHIPSLALECDEQIRKLELLLAKSSEDLGRRRNTIVPRDSDIHEAQRRRMIAEHRAAHHFIFGRALREAISVVRSLKVCPTGAACGVARIFLDERVRAIQNLVVRTFFVTLHSLRAYFQLFASRFFIRLGGHAESAENGSRNFGSPAENGVSKPRFDIGRTCSRHSCVFRPPLHPATDTRLVSDATGSYLRPIPRNT
jgi:hypothetical protein